MRTLTALWIISTAIAVGSANAEDPVYFADAGLKAAVEETLSISDPTPTDMLGLTRLDASRREIKDLTGLQYATNLQWLDLRQNLQISDISALAHLINLDFLNIHMNQISDISALAGLNHLQTLILRQNRIGSISALSGLGSLLKLDLRDNSIGDISALAGLTSLQELSLWNNSITDVSALAGLRNLQKLYLPWNQISNISVLSGLNKLVVLNLRMNRISDISALTGLANLITLDLTANTLNANAYCHDLRSIVTRSPGVSVSYDPNPAAPTNLRASDGLYPDKVLLTWDALCNGPAYTTYYRLSRATSQDGTKSPLGDWQTDLHFDDQTAQPGARYTYWVQAAISSQGLNAGDYSIPDVGWRRVP